MHRWGLMRFKNSFSLLSQKVKKLFFPFFFAKYLFQSSHFEQQKIFFPFFVYLKVLFWQTSLRTILRRNGS